MCSPGRTRPRSCLTEQRKERRDTAKALNGLGFRNILLKVINPKPYINLKSYINPKPYKNPKHPTKLDLCEHLHANIACAFSTILYNTKNTIRKNPGPIACRSQIPTIPDIPLCESARRLLVKDRQTLPRVFG